MLLAPSSYWSHKTQRILLTLPGVPRPTGSSELILVPPSVEFSQWREPPPASSLAGFDVGLPSPRQFLDWGGGSSSKVVPVVTRLEFLKEERVGQKAIVALILT